MDAVVGGHASCFGIDRGNRLLQEAHPGLGNVAVGEADRVGPRPPEHHVELRVSEDERVVLVDQRHIDVARRAPPTTWWQARAPQIPPPRRGPASPCRRPYPTSVGLQSSEVAEPVAGALFEGEAGFGGLALEAGEGGEVGVAEQLADHQAAGRLEDAVDLAQGGDRVGDLAQDGGEDDGVDRVVLVGEGGGVALGGDDVGEAALGGAAAWRGRGTPAGGRRSRPCPRGRPTRPCRGCSSRRRGRSPAPARPAPGAAPGAAGRG